MVCTTLATVSRPARSTGRCREAIASGKLTPSPMTSAVMLTSTWLPR